MKRVKKAKMEEADSAAISDEISFRESLPGGHSVLEISGPTIPSPGPSGRRCILSIRGISHSSQKKKPK